MWKNFFFRIFLSTNSVSLAITGKGIVGRRLLPLELILLTLAFSFGLGMAAQEAAELIQTAIAGIPTFQAAGKLNACLFLGYVTSLAALELKSRLSRLL